MRFYVIGVLVLIPALALLSLVQPFITGFAERPIGPEFVASRTGPGDAARGEALYVSKCYGCHVSQANLGPALNTADFKARYPDDEALAFAIRAGREPMPVFTYEMMSDQELADIVAYIRSLPPQE